MAAEERLLPEQVALLRFIWRPLVEASQRRSPANWPVWDYVQRSLHRQFRDLPDALGLLQSLPTVAIPQAPRVRSYGLVWHTGHVAMMPGPENRIGLTIAGLLRLSQYGEDTLALADGLASIIGAAAEHDEEQEPQPFTVLHTQKPLRELTTKLWGPMPLPPKGMPDRLVAEGLTHEHAPMIINPVEGEFAHQVLLGRMSLRAYLGVKTATEYLGRVELVETEQQQPPQYASPLTLIQTLDYLSLTLAADENWPDGLRLIQAPDLLSAASIAAPVGTRADYNNALSALWNILAHLRTPPVQERAAPRKADQRPPGSLASLEKWLRQRLEAASYERSRQAIGLVRAVGRLRTEGQHGSVSVRQEARRARQRLGLPDIITDFEQAWSLVTDQVAGALEAIRVEVALAGAPD